jgi:hypothetical protein
MNVIRMKGLTNLSSCVSISIKHQARPKSDTEDPKQMISSRRGLVLLVVFSEQDPSVSEEFPLHQPSLVWNKIIEKETHYDDNKLVHD